MRAALLSWIVLLCLCAQASAQATFQDFIGKDSPCGDSAAYGTFVESLRNRFQYDKSETTPLAVPEAIKAQFGEPKAKKEGDWTKVTVPMSGTTYRELSVAELILFLGNDNGILIKNIVFSDGMKPAQARLADIVKKTNEQLRRERAEIGGSDSDYVQLRSHAKGTELSCDLST